MTTLLAETFKWCIANGVVNANLSIDTDVSKTRWGPFSVTYQDSHLARASRRGRLVEWAVKTRKRYSS